MPEHQDNHIRKHSPLSQTYSLAVNISDHDEDDQDPFGGRSPEPDDRLWFSLLDSPPPYTLACPKYTPLAQNLPPQSAYVDPTMIGAMHPIPTPSCPYPSSPPSQPPLQNAFYSPPVPDYQLPLPQIAQPAIAVSDTPPEKGLPRCALPGTLDPTTGIFYRNPEHRRLRTAQACEKCRIRKAKCSGDHPTCQRCRIRGLICHYASEGRIRGPNKTKLKAEVKSDPQLSMNAHASTSGSPPSARIARPSVKSNMYPQSHTEIDMTRSIQNTTTKAVSTSAVTSTVRRRSLMETDITTNAQLSGIVPGTLTQVGVRSNGSGVESNSMSVRGSRTPSTSSSTSPVITRSNSVGLPKTPDSFRDSPRLSQNHDTYLFGTSPEAIGINAYSLLGDVDADEHPGMFGEYLEWREVKEEWREGRFFF